MDFQKIQEQLNNEFTGEQRQIIFWYDENKEFEEDIHNLVIDNAKVLILSGKDYFKVKYILEIEDKESHYLLYAPFARPDDLDNPLLDTLLYSKTFYADYYYLLAEDLEISKKIINHLKLYDKFFKSKVRIQAFKSLNKESLTQEDIDLCILSIITKTKVVNFNEILKNILLKGFKDNKYIENIDRFGSIDVFWSYVSKYFGYEDENPSLYKLMVHLLITHISGITNTLPSYLEQYILSRKAEASLFIDNLKNNNKTESVFDDLSKDIAQSLNIKNAISKMSIEDIGNNDVFMEFDEQYIHLLIENVLMSTNLDKYEIYINIRENTHFYNLYEHTYLALKYAFHLIKNINLFKQFCHSITIQDYVEKYAIIDKYYHLYVYHYDKIHRDDFNQLNTFIENKYNNEYFGPINIFWDKQLLEYNSYENIPGLKQQSFYKNIIGSKWEKEKTCVIISDALRYEIGIQVHEYLSKLPKYTSEINYMISSIPSYTQLGMASLLPHSSIEVNDDCSITIQGHSTNGLENRDAILRKYNNSFKALQYEYIKNLKGRDALRKELDKNIRLLYVYHNQIDTRGDHALTENEVFDAAQEAINEIESVIKRLRDDVNFTKFIITSDHGFIYRRKEIAESDKINVLKSDNMLVNKRYILSSDIINQEGMIGLNTNYLCKDNNKKVYIPKGGNIFKTQGSGQHFVHGGASLQEIVIPLIEVKTTARKVNVEPVNIELIPTNNKITNLSARFNFVQIDSICDTVIAREYVVYFIDENKNIISNQVSIRANIESNDISNRMFTVSFNFVNKKYYSRQNYYMIIDDEDGIEYKRYQFIFDLAFADDFGFEF